MSLPGLTGQSSTPGRCLLDRPVEPGDDRPFVFFSPSSPHVRRGAPRAPSRLRMPPDRGPVGAGDVSDAAVALEELVGHLEHGEHQPALGAPGRMAAAGRTPDEIAFADLEAGVGPLAVD